MALTPATLERIAEQKALVAKAVEDGDEDFESLFSKIPNNPTTVQGISKPGLKKAFLIMIRAGSTGTIACERLGINRATYKEWNRKDPIFNICYKLAREEAAELLIEEARRRAVDGTVVQERPIVDKEGNVVAIDRRFEYSDRLLEYLIRIEAGTELDPKYRADKKLEITGRVEHFMTLAEGAAADQEEFDRQLEQLKEGEIVDVEPGSVREVHTDDSSDSGVRDQGEE